MEKATEYKDEEMQKIVEDVKSFVLEVNPKFLTTLKYKFSKQEYQEVASIPFKFWDRSSLESRAWGRSPADAERLTQSVRLYT